MGTEAQAHTLDTMSDSLLLGSLWWNWRLQQATEMAGIVRRSGHHGNPEFHLGLQAGKYLVPPDAQY